MNVIKRNTTDNSEFIVNIEAVIQDRIDIWQPNEVYITRIDNWFDIKWLKFSGTIMHEISIYQLIEITIPPFHPNRVEICNKYCKNNGIYIETKLDKPLHIFQSSSENLKRKISNFSKNGLFIWFSSNSETNKNGSLMIYYICENTIFTFYASLTLEQNWLVDKSKGMTKKEIDKVINNFATERINTTNIGLAQAGAIVLFGA
jgi:hypothetical protein